MFTCWAEGQEVGGMEEREDPKEDLIRQGEDGSTLVSTHGGDAVSMDVMIKKLD